MAQAPTREQLSGTATSEAGWTVERVTPPSRLNGANGIRTGADGRIYVAQVAGSTVSAVDPDTGAIETISPVGGPITGPDDLVFDDEGNLYCTEITEGRVTMLAPNGESRVIWGDVPVANPITFHQGRLIAGELRMDGRIREFDRNGGEPRVILDNVPMPNAFEVGPDGKLYFPVQGINEIWRVSLDGGEPEVVAKDLGVPDSVKFHPDGYIVSTQVGTGQVLKIDPQTGEQTVLAQLDPGLDNVAFVGGRTFISHITGSIHEIIEPGKAKPLIDRGFQWPMGLAVSGDGTVHAADGMFAYTIPPGGEAECVGMLFIPGFPGFMRGLALDGSGNWVVTTANGTVARWKPGQEAEQLAVGFEVPMGIAIMGDGIVFTDAGAGRILSLDGGEVTELASGVDKPYGVAVTDTGSIYASLPDAGEVVQVYGGKTQSVLDGLDRPEGIAIKGDSLFVVETGGKRVAKLDLTSGTTEILAENLPVGPPQGVAPLRLGGVGDMCGPMWTFTGIAVGRDGTVYVSGDTEGSVLALRQP